MLLIDYMMIAMAVAATGFFVVQRRALARANAQIGTTAILIGLWVQASLYIADLYAMTVMPETVGMEAALAAMHRLHDNYSWYFNAASAVLILSGLAFALLRLIDQSRAAIREREAAQHSEQRLRTVFDSEPECVKTIDRDGRLLDMNPAGLAMIEVDDLAAVRGLSVVELIAPPHREAFRKNLADVFAGKRTHLQFEIVGNRGTRRWMDQVAVPLMARDGSGEVVEMLAVTRDVTKQMAAFEELSVQKQKAESANEAKTRFLANMSHEIRTPLNGVLGMAQVLARKDLGAPHNDYVATILDSGDALMAIVNDVLDVAKIEAKRLDLMPEPTELRHSLSRALALWQPTADKKGLGLHLTVDDTVPETLVFDDGRVRQCVSNLLSNALKFTETGDIAVAVSADGAASAGTAGPRIKITVTDKGIGISEEDQARLFDAFEQADNSSSRAYGGTGLGLTISRKLARLMGGDLTVSSRLGDGARFTLSFETALPEQFKNRTLQAAQG